MDNWITASTIGKRFWTPELVSLKFDAKIAPFKAGQFIRVGMDIQGERTGRPYSLVNAPNEHPYEIHFNIVKGGSLSPLLAKLNEGDKFWAYKMSLGFLVLDEVPDVPDLWLIATGTAISPFLSMIKTSSVWRRFDNIVLVHGVRTADELSYNETITRALGKHPGQFHFIPVVSREVVPGTIHGRIPASINDLQLERHAGLSLDPTRSHVMLCGNSGMISAATTTLAERGMKPHRRHDPGHISTEKYF